MERKTIVVETVDSLITINPLHVSHIFRTKENGKQCYVWFGENFVPLTQADCDKFLEEFNTIMK